MTLALAIAAALLQSATPPPVAAPSIAPTPAATTKWPVRDHDVILRDFSFRSGERLPQLKIHYITLGTPRRDAKGDIVNGVMVLHGTGGSGSQFLSPPFADALYGPGAPLDLARWFVILPDNIGHGRSSKPSDGMRMRFPNYDYADMVEAQRRMLVEGLTTRHLRLIMGTSMGCMHGFIWGEAHPDFARALMPMACLPVEIGGINRMWRQLAIDGIRADPAWMGGNYKAQPELGLRTAVSLLQIAGGAPLYLQAQYPTRDAAAAYIRKRVVQDMPTRDANDLIYQLESSRSYDPSRDLEKITVPLTWLNSADDFINPHGLGIAETAVKRMPNARFRLIAETAETRGHGTHTWARFWKQDLVELLARSER
ncbi:MAG TPA: alpha/beta fold hydrolase [Sphingomonas sp.]|nr:alpha/beta fold hydrolase [Sphingomonas sp.]